MLTTEHTLLRMFLNIWRQILFLGDLDDDALLNFCRTECGTLNCPPGLQLPAPEQLPLCFYLITGLILLDCFDKSDCSRKAFC